MHQSCDSLTAHRRAKRDSKRTGGEAVQKRFQSKLWNVFETSGVSSALKRERVRTYTCEDAWSSLLAPRSRERGRHLHPGRAQHAKQPSDACQPGLVQEHEEELEAPRARQPAQHLQHELHSERHRVGVGRRRRGAGVEALEQRDERGLGQALSEDGGVLCRGQTREEALPRREGLLAQRRPLALKLLRRARDLRELDRKSVV